MYNKLSRRVVICSTEDQIVNLTATVQPWAIYFYFEDIPNQ